jgi:hypothetical protein
MPTATSRRLGRATRLDSPRVAVAAPGRYLRQRARAEQAWRIRRRAAKVRLLCWLIGCLLFYLMIGRDLVAMTVAASRAESTHLSKDAKTLAKDLKRLIDTRKAMADTTGKVPLPPEMQEVAGEGESAADGPARR